MGLPIARGDFFVLIVRGVMRSETFCLFVSSIYHPVWVERQGCERETRFGRVRRFVLE